MNKNNIRTTLRGIPLFVITGNLLALMIAYYIKPYSEQLFIFLLSINLIVFILNIGYLIIITRHYKGLENVFEALAIKSSLETSLASIGAYIDLSENYIITPAVKVYPDKNEIVIVVDNFKYRSKIESNQGVLSSGLPNGIITYSKYLSEDENEFIIIYENIKNNKRATFDNAIDYIEYLAKVNSPTTLVLDNKNLINLVDNCHLLITGKSGSGKSVFAQSLIIQGIMKHWDISILDYKRSYQAFTDYCKVSFKVDEIVSELEEVIKELHKRQEAMDKKLKTDTKALAIDMGFPVKFVLIEEYLALVNSGADKKTLDKIEKMILEITTTGRSLNIYLCMVLQVSSANALNTSIRSNLPIKIVFGNPDRTIYETTFGKGAVPETTKRMDKGEGLCSIDGNIVPFSAPYLKFNLLEALKLLN